MIHGPVPGTPQDPMACSGVDVGLGASTGPERGPRGAAVAASLCHVLIQLVSSVLDEAEISSN